MRKHFPGVIAALLTISYFSFPVLAQQIQIPSLQLPKRGNLSQGQFLLSPPDAMGSFSLEAYGAPLGDVLLSIAQRANHQLIVSDDAQTVLDMSTVTISKTVAFTPEQLFELLTVNNFSWGKVGQDTYLLVLRKKSAAELAEENKLQNAAKRLAPAVPQYQQEEHPGPRFYLLSPQTKQN